MILTRMTRTHTRIQHANLSNTKNFTTTRHAHAVKSPYNPLGQCNVEIAERCNTHGVRKTPYQQGRKPITQRYHQTLNKRQTHGTSSLPNYGVIVPTQGKTTCTRVPTAVTGTKTTPLHIPLSGRKLYTKSLLHRTKIWKQQVSAFTERSEQAKCSNPSGWTGNMPC